jgi:hypothetical protein
VVFQIRFSRGKQLSPVQSKRKKGLNRLACKQFRFTVRSHGDDRPEEPFCRFDGKAIPDPHYRGPTARVAPNSALAAALQRLFSTSSKTEFQGSIAAVSDLALKLDNSPASCSDFS